MQILISSSNGLTDQYVYLPLCFTPQIYSTSLLLRWDVMEEYVASTPDATSWSVGVARLFVSARQLDRQTFGSCVKAMKAEQLIPLSS